MLPLSGSIFYFLKCFFFPFASLRTYLWFCSAASEKEPLNQMSVSGNRKIVKPQIVSVFNVQPLLEPRLNNPCSFCGACGSELLEFLLEFSEAKPAFGEWMCWSCGASQQICVWINTLGRFLAATEPAVFYSAILKLRLGTSGSLTHLRARTHTRTHTLAPISPPV